MREKKALAYLNVYVHLKHDADDNNDGGVPVVVQVEESHDREEKMRDDKLDVERVSRICLRFSGLLAIHIRHGILGRMPVYQVENEESELNHEVAQHDFQAINN